MFYSLKVIIFRLRFDCLWKNLRCTFLFKLDFGGGNLIKKASIKDIPYFGDSPILDRKVTFKFERFVNKKRRC